MVNRLLDELAARCIAGDCDSTTAAKLVGIRRASWEEYVRQASARNKAHRRLVAAFHHAFPECDPRLAVTYRNAPDLKADDLLRGGPVAPCVTYTAEQAASLAPAQRRLILGDPEGGSGWDRIPGVVCNNTNNIGSGGELPDGALETTGVEFQFAA